MKRKLTQPKWRPSEDWINNLILIAWVLLVGGLIAHNILTHGL